MFCKNCGSQVDDTLNFCTNCGTAVNRAQPNTAPRSSVPSQKSASIPIPLICVLGVVALIIIIVAVSGGNGNTGTAYRTNQTQTTTQQPAKNAKSPADVKCPSCQGTTMIDCLMCGGTGRDPFSFNGSLCLSCAGLKKITCPSCMGAGFWMPLPSTTGSSSGSSSGGSLKSLNSCPHCHGSGICDTCHGKGWFSNSYGTGDVACPNCYMINGSRSGKCKFCRGTGQRN